MIHNIRWLDTFFGAVPNYGRCSIIWSMFDAKLCSMRVCGLKFELDQNLSFCGKFGLLELFFLLHLSSFCVLCVCYLIFDFLFRYFYYYYLIGLTNNNYLFNNSYLFTLIFFVFQINSALANVFIGHYTVITVNQI